jgi:hypothetical protein
MLKLPKHPKTNGQLRFVRYWLRQLSQAHFEICEYWVDVFNPVFTGIVFPPDEWSQEEHLCLSFGTLKVKKNVNEEKNPIR